METPRRANGMISRRSATQRRSKKRSAPGTPPPGALTSSSAAPDWPTGHIPQATDPNALIRIRPPAFAQKPFGETFGAATGVSAPSYRRNHGPSATSFKTRLQIRQQGGQAATVAGEAGPGFHTWLTGHILQDNGYETADSQPVPCKEDVRRDVRRRDRGQRPQPQGTLISST
jgi:hypothetical protein